MDTDAMITESITLIKLTASEGWFSEAEYAPIKAERERIRNEIRELEK